MSKLYKILFCSCCSLIKERSLSKKGDVLSATFLVSFALNLNVLTVPLLGVFVGKYVSNFYAYPNIKLVTVFVSLFVLALNFYMVYVAYGAKKLESIYLDMELAQGVRLVRWGSMYVGFSVLFPIFIWIYMLFF